MIFRVVLASFLLVSTVARNATSGDDMWSAKFCNELGQCCVATASLTNPTFKCTAQTTHGFEVFTLYPGPYPVGGSAMMLHISLALGDRAFQVPVYANQQKFFTEELSVVQTLDLNGNFRNETGSYSIRGSNPVTICNTFEAKCCTTASVPGSCVIGNNLLSVKNVGLFSTQCGNAASWYLFGKTELNTGHSMKLCAIGDPTVYYSFQNAGDNHKDIRSQITITLTN